MTRPEAVTAILSERLGPSTVDEVRAIRAQLDDECGHDLHRLAENARMIAEEFRQRHSDGGAGGAK